MSLLTTIRQYQYPREFRIAPSPWSDKTISLIEQLTQAYRQALTAPPANRKTASPNVRLLAEVGTGLWRLRQKMVQPGTDKPLEEMRRAYRHLESTWDAMVQAGVEIQDHTGVLFDSGMSLKVIAFQPMPGLQREKVIETIKPSIYYQKQQIQMGEVIVGTPEEAETDQ